MVIHHDARFNLGAYENGKGRVERAIKHFIIAANLGDDAAMQELKEFYKYGGMNKEQFASALRAHQAAADATKSPQREEFKALEITQCSKRGGNAASSNF